MTPDTLRSIETEPAGLTPALRALRLDARGDWNAAHDALQDDPGADTSWVHAYLHRKEGDLGNAGYWYRRAGQPTPTGPLDDEWHRIATALLAAQSTP
ncbi:MAG: hypothetical protein ACKO5K_12510 [Armatimonadota bacterium]